MNFEKWWEKILDKGVLDELGINPDFIRPFFESAYLCGKDQKTRTPVGEYCQYCGAKLIHGRCPATVPF